MEPTDLSSLRIDGDSFHTLLHHNRDYMNIPMRFAESHADVLQSGIADLVDPVGNVFHCQVSKCGTRVQFVDVFGEILCRHNLEGTVIIHFRHIEDDHYNIQIFYADEREIHYVDPNHHEPHGCEHIWTTDLTLELCRGNKPLPIPAQVIDNHFAHYPNSINVVLPNRYVTQWFLDWDQRSYHHCMIGTGWYEYCRESRFYFTDQLRFFKLQPPDTFKVVVVRHP